MTYSVTVSGTNFTVGLTSVSFPVALSQVGQQGVPGPRGDVSISSRKNVAAVLADTVWTYATGQNGTVTAGDIVTTEAEGFSYEVAASGATDQHVTTAGGVKLYVLQFTFKSLGLTGVGIETTRYLAALAAIPDGAFVQADVDITVADTGVISASGVHVYGTATITQTGSNKKTINFTNAQDCTVTGVSFVGKGTEHDGANTSYNGVAAIFFTDAVNCTVDRVKVTNHAGGHIACSNPNGLTVKNSVITGIGAAGGISPLNNNADFAIGCFSTNPDNNITVEGCYISDCCFGIGAARGSGLIVRGNFFLNTPGQHHIYASAMSDMIVSDNYFGPCEGEAVKNQIAAASDVNTDNVVVANNVFKDTGLSCVAISWASGATVGRHKGVLVHGNVARGIGNYFAVIRRCDRGDVIDNVFEEISAAALDLQDWRGRVSGNKIRDGEWYAINATVNGDCEFSNNIIEDVALNSAGAATTLNNQVMAFISAFTGTGHLIEWRNNVMKMNSAPTNLIYSLRSAASVNIALDGGANLSGYPLLMLAATYNDGLHTPNVDNASTATLTPTVPIYGRGKRHLYGTQNPASASMTDTFRQGDVCWNTTPAASGKVGWVCVASGTPGTWKAFGAIDA